MMVYNTVSQTWTFRTKHPTKNENMLPIYGVAVNSSGTKKEEFLSPHQMHNRGNALGALLIISWEDDMIHKVCSI